MLARLGRVIFWMCTGLAIPTAILAVSALVFGVVAGFHQQGSVVYPGIIVYKDAFRYGAAYDPDSQTGFRYRRGDWWETSSVRVEPDGSITVYDGEEWLRVPREPPPRYGPWYDLPPFQRGLETFALLGICGALTYGFGRAARYVLANE